MQSQRQQPWQIKVYSKSKYFDFKLEATSILPSWKPFPFPIKLKLKLKLRPPLLQSKKSDTNPRKGKSLKSKFNRILGKFRKNKAVVAKQTSNLGDQDAHFPANRPKHFAYEEPLCVSSIVIGFIALLFQSITHKDQKRMVLFCLLILVYLALIFKKLVMGRTRNVLVIVIVAMLSCPVGVYQSITFKISEGYVSDCIWKALNYVCNYVPFAQAIQSSLSQYVEAHRGDILLTF